jgi:hypothetical protein
MNKNFIYLASLFIVLVAAGNIHAGLVGWWKFDEDSGSIAFDSSGNGYYGTLIGDSTWIIGRLDGALQFDGDGDYVTCGHIDIDTAVTGGLAVCAWINKPTGGDMKVCSNRQVSSAPGGGFTCAIYNNRMEMDMCNEAARVLYRDTQGTVLPGDTWMHLAWVYNDETDTYDEYRDGNLVATQAATTSIGISTAEFRIANDSPSSGHYFNGMIDDMRIYDHALDQLEILDAMEGRGPQITRAIAPVPEDGEPNVPRDISLFWTPGEYPKLTHNVYFSTNFDDVNDSIALVSPSQDANFYSPGRLEFDQKYFWRIDEVNATDGTVYTGAVWSFTVEPYLYPISGGNITVTASSQATDQGPENTINYSGLDTNDTHSTVTTTMWLTDAGATGPAWIKYEFDNVYKLDQILVWNYNGQSALAGFGVRDVVIEYSTDDINWAQLGDTIEFPKASGKDDYASDIILDFNGAPVKYVRMNFTSNWFPVFPQYGLSEVRFLYVPAQARSADPADGATDVAVDVTVSWIPGRESAEHKVYVSTDRQAVINDTAPVVTVHDGSSPSGTGRVQYGPLSLDLGSIYYWRVDEVNGTDIWQGGIWSFTTTEYLILDDFESYNDIEQGQEGSNLVYLTWIDGYDNPAINGSTIGYSSGVSMETDIVHGGRQSVPIMYDNTNASLSEITANLTYLTIGRDWSVGSPAVLTLWFYGDSNNSATDRMYVKINGVKVTCDGSLDQNQWQEFSVDLTSLGINLVNVTSLMIGFESVGSGKVFLDDIQLN